MNRKVFNISIELEIRTIDCPGVWLCNHGCVSLILEAFGSQYETKSTSPLFPIKFHEVFKFRKTIDNADSLESLKKSLEREFLQCELIQWSSDRIGKVGLILSEYTGSFCDILYSTDIFDNNSIDLLMKTSKNFPGILSPKINVMTRIQINEVINYDLINNPYKLYQIRCEKSSRMNVQRQRSVCHSRNFHEFRSTLDADKNKTAEYKNIIISSDNCDHRFNNHDRKRCSVCSEYYDLFYNIPKVDDELTYMIPDEHNLTRRCAEIIGDNKYKGIDNNKKYKRFDRLLCDNDSSCIQRKYDLIKSHCLCRNKQF